MTKEEALAILHCRRVAMSAEHLALHCELDIAQHKNDKEAIENILDRANKLAKKYSIDEPTVRKFLEEAK